MSSTLCQPSSVGAPVSVPCSCKLLVSASAALMDGLPLRGGVDMSSSQIELGPERREMILAQMQRDVDFLKKHDILDYSLLLGIFYRDRKFSFFTPTRRDAPTPTDSPVLPATHRKIRLPLSLRTSSVGFRNVLRFLVPACLALSGPSTS